MSKQIETGAACQLGGKCTCTHTVYNTEEEKEEEQQCCTIWERGTRDDEMGELLLLLKVTPISLGGPLWLATELGQQRRSSYFAPDLPLSLSVFRHRYAFE